MLRSDSPRPPDAGVVSAGLRIGAVIPGDDDTGGAGGVGDGGAGVTGPREGGAGVPSSMSALLPRENGMSLDGCGARSTEAARRSRSDATRGRSGGTVDLAAVSTSMNGSDC